MILIIFINMMIWALLWNLALCLFKEYMLLCLNGSSTKNLTFQYNSRKFYFVECVEIYNWNISRKQHLIGVLQKWHCETQRCIYLHAWCGWNDGMWEFLTLKLWCSSVRILSIQTGHSPRKTSILGKWSLDKYMCDPL